MKFKGCNNFRQRLVCATLSGRPLLITHIRSEEEEPGLRDFEGGFLRLLERLTNGCQVEINETGTVLRYIPGIIVGGRHEHDCGSARSISWFLEGILPLAVFAKQPLHLSLSGLTNDSFDVSVDNVKAVILPLLAYFGAEGATLNVKKRGLPPSGGGHVEFSCPIVRELRPCNLVDAGLIKRVRGVAYCAKISPQFANRVVTSARGLLNRLLPDVYVHTDHYKGLAGGHSPGFGLTLVAESTTGCLLAVDVHAKEGALPEDVGERGSALLLEEVRRGGCVDSVGQALVLLLMALGPEDVSKVRIGQLTMHGIQTLRLAREAFGVTFKIRADTETGTVLLSCLGSGVRNFSKKVT